MVVQLLNVVNHVRNVVNHVQKLKNHVRNVVNHVQKLKNHVQNVVNHVQKLNELLNLKKYAVKIIKHQIYLMEESKKSIHAVLKFLRELAVVVIGISITVSLGFWINNSNNKKDLKQYLDAIQLELKANVEQLDWCTQWLQKSVRYADYIKSNDKNSLNKDSLAYYAQTDYDGCGYMYFTSLSTIFPTNAFEMLKFSGVMRQIEDKGQLLEIWMIYTRIETTALNFDKYFRIKEEEAIKNLQLQAEEKPIDVPMQTFYSSGMPYEMVRQSKQVSDAIKKTLSNLEKAKTGK